jgi:hypothetical protein
MVEAGRKSLMCGTSDESENRIQGLFVEATAEVTDFLA